MTRRELDSLKPGDTIVVGNHRETDRVTKVFRARFIRPSIRGAIHAKPSRGVERNYRGDHVIAILGRA